MKQIVEAVRERERELQFNEVSFFKYAQNIEVIFVKKSQKYINEYKKGNINLKRIGYYVKQVTKVKMLHNSLSFL